MTFRAGAGGPADPARFRPGPRTLRTALSLLALLVIQGLLTVPSVFRETATYDEADHLRYGMQVLEGRTERFDDSKMPVSALNAAFARVTGRSDPTQLATIRPARLATVIAGLALTVACFLWGRALYGPAAGFVAAGALVFDPTFLAHSRLVTTDVWAALGITTALASAWRYSRTPTLGRALVAGLALGAAQLCKFTAVVLFPLLFVVVVVRHVAGRPRAGETGPPAPVDPGTRRGTVHLGLALAASLFVLNAGYLFQGTGAPLSSYRFRSAGLQRFQEGAGIAGRIPLPVPRAWLEGLDWVREYERTGKNYGRIYLFGEHRSGSGFLGYFLVVGLFKVPIGTQLLLILAAVSLARRLGEPGFWRDESFLVVPLAFFAFYFNVLFRAQIGIRFLLVAFPLAYVLAGSLLREGWRGSTRGRRAVLGVAAGATMASVLYGHPFHMAYVNELLPDRNRAFRIFADSSLDYGQADGYFEEYQRRHPEVVREPDEPVAGTIAARINWLAGISEKQRDKWLGDRFQPVGNVGGSWLLFRVSPEEAARARREMGVAEPPGLRGAGTAR